MASLRPMPHPGVPLVDANGQMTMDWRLYFASRERVGTLNLTDVSSTAPANGESLIWNSTTGKWTPGPN
jgi:hypothetical protein